MGKFLRLLFRNAHSKEQSLNDKFRLKNNFRGFCDTLCFGLNINRPLSDQSYDQSYKELLFCLNDEAINIRDHLLAEDCISPLDSWSGALKIVFDSTLAANSQRLIQSSCCADRELLSDLSWQAYQMSMYVLNNPRLNEGGISLNDKTYSPRDFLNALVGNKNHRDLVEQFYPLMPPMRPRPRLIS